MLQVLVLALFVSVTQTASPIARLKETLQTYGHQSALPNGFPNITNPSQALSAIQVAAKGTLPNGSPPSTLAEDDLTSLRLIAFNELFEVAFFTSLLGNVTNCVQGFEISNNRNAVIQALKAVIAQEELHALNANIALGANPIQPCQYVFPTVDFTSAIGLAITFTDVALGTLQDVIVHLAQNDDEAVTRGVASVIGQEGEQNGFYRFLLGKIPSALPFLTASSREFAFSALNQNFIVPDSCPLTNTIDLPIFPSLTINTSPIKAKNQNLSFTFNSSSVVESVSSLSLVYINQQNTPIVQPLQNPHTSGNNLTTFEALFPGGDNEMNGLTIAALTNSSGPFATPNEVAAATIAGPGLIEIN